jgi:hypothetical protein
MRGQRDKSERDRAKLSLLVCKASENAEYTSEASVLLTCLGEDVFDEYIITR